MRWTSKLTLPIFTLLPFTLSADPLTDALNAAGINAVLQGSGISIDVDALNPQGTNDNDTLGADLFTPENGLGVTLGGTEILGFGSTTGSAIPLDFLGLQQLTQMLGLTPDSALVEALRNTVGPDGALIVPVVDSIQSLSNLGDSNFDLSSAITLPGLDQQPVGLAIAGSDSSGNTSEGGVAGVALLTPGSSGNGGLVGLAVISGNGSGNGELVGISLLGDDNSGNGGLAGVAVLGGDNAGNSQTLSLSALSGSNTGNAGLVGIGAINEGNSGNGGLAGVGAINGDNSGNGGTAGVSALSGDNSGNGGFAGASAINGANSGSGSTVGAAALSGDNSGNSNVIGAAAISGDDSGNGGVGGIDIGSDNNGDGSDGSETGGNCDGVGCADDQSDDNTVAGLTSRLEEGSQCTDGDADGDGICDGADECPDTPKGAAVFPTGCHLDSENPLVLRGVNFEFNLTDITEPSKELLKQARNIIAKYPQVLIAIDGHTDNKGSDSYNQKLSQRRAERIMQYFIDNGIKPERLVARGFGESKPMAANSDENGADNAEGRAQNRRVELTIVEREAFEQIRTENAERLAAEKKAAQEAALAEQRRREREREQARQAEQQQKRVEKAEEDYEDVLNFLEESGSAERDASPESGDIDAGDNVKENSAEQ